MRLIPPHITSLVVGIGIVAAAVAGTPAAAGAIHQPDPISTLFGAVLGPKIEAAAILIGSLCTAIAGAGRSFVPSIDAGTKPPADAPGKE